MLELEHLLHRLDQAVAAPQAGQGNAQPIDQPHDQAPDPLSEVCEQVADALLGLGLTAAAARWRSWALLPPPPPQLAAAIAEVRQELVRYAPESDGQLPVDPVAAARQVLALQLALPAASQVAAWARALLAAGDGAAAVELLQRQAVAGGLQPDHCNAIASALLQLEQWWEAERWLCTSLSRQRNQPRPWFLLARLLLQQGVLDEAFEAVQQGLARDPTSDWGRNLRARILLAGGSWRSYDLLTADPQGLPSDPALRQDLQDNAQRHRLSHRTAADAPTADLPLGERLRLRHLFPRDGLVVVLHGHPTGALHWCLAQELLPAGLEVQPVASREPLLMAEALATAGLRSRSEQSSPLLRQLAADANQAVALLVIQRPSGSKFPTALGLLWPKVAHLLTPVGLVEPPGFSAVASLGGWQLLASSQL